MCLYSEDSTFPRSLFAVSQSASSKDFFGAAFFAVFFAAFFGAAFFFTFFAVFFFAAIVGPLHYALRLYLILS